MADDFILPPTTQYMVTVTIPAKFRPYIEEWYRDRRKNATESPEEFLLRLMLRQALNHRQQKVSGQIAEEEQVALQAVVADREKLVQDFQQEMGDVE